MLMSSTADWLNSVDAVGTSE